MDTGVAALARDCTYLDVYALLRRCEADELPIVSSSTHLLLIGSVRRAAPRGATVRARKGARQVV